MLVAWPSDDFLNKARVGATFALHPVAKTTTAADGSYDLKVTGPSDLEPYATQKTGAVALEIVAGDKTQTVPFGFSAIFDDAAPSLRVATSSTTQKAQANASFVIGDRGSDTGIADRAQSEVPGQPLASLSGGSSTEYEASQSPVNANAAYGCSGKVLKKPKAPELLAVQYSKTKAAKMRYHYTRNANTSMGWGYSLSKTGGSWSQKGTKTVGSENSIDFAQKRGKGVFLRKTTVKYALVRTKCQNYPGGPTTTTYDMLPFHGATADRPTKKIGARYVPSVPASNCSRMAPGSGVVVNSSTATYWTNGVSFTQENLSAEYSAQTGYSTNSAVKFTNRSQRAVSICGTFDDVASSPGSVLMRR